MRMKSIETFYNGYRFRSRAEARWAMFFDLANIPYFYEPEGLEFEDGTKYLPDFYLPDCDTWFEVKGVMDKASRHKIEALLSTNQKPVVIGYPDMTFEACDLWEDDAGKRFYTRASKRESCLAQCKSCGKLWFMGLQGMYDCLCCGEYDGDHHFTTVLDGDGDYFFSSPEVKNYKPRYKDWNIVNAVLAAKEYRFGKA